MVVVQVMSALHMVSVAHDHEHCEYQRTFDLDRCFEPGQLTSRVNSWQTTRRNARVSIHNLGKPVNAQA
jgi:hypothetical protein